MYVCMYVCVYIYIYIYTPTSDSRINSEFIRMPNQVQLG